MAERPRLFEYLEPDLLAKVEAKYPLELLLGLERGLDSVERLTHARPFLPVKPGYKDTDLRHTIGMLGLRREFMRRFPYLREEIDWEEVARQIVIHDVAETRKKIGDVPSHGEARETEDSKRKKRYEPKVGQALLSSIPDPIERERAKHSYHRFTKQEDKEALFVRYLDKAQATIIEYPIYVFNYRALEYSQPWHKLIEHVRESTLIVTNAAINLCAALSPKSGSEIVEFTIEGLTRFKPIGFKTIANARIRELLLATS